MEYYFLIIYMGNRHFNKVHDKSTISIDNYHNLLHLSTKEKSNLRIITSDKKTYYIYYDINKSDMITVDMVLHVLIDNSLRHKCILDEEFKNRLNISHKTILKQYIQRAAIFNLIVNNVVYLPIH